MTHEGGAIVLIALSVAVGCYVALQLNETKLLWDRLKGEFSQNYRLLFIARNPRQDARRYLLCNVGIVLGALWFEALWVMVLVPATTVGPLLWMRMRRYDKRDAIVVELPAWMDRLADNLNACPNLTDAIARGIFLCSGALAREMEWVISETSLGVALEVALARSAERVGSQTYSSALAALVVAKRSGGALPALLKESAGELREIERLEGVVRTKTAEGRSQLLVMAFLPFIAIAALHKMDPSTLPKLLGIGLGQVILVIAGMLWGASIAIALKIVRVEV